MVKRLENIPGTISRGNWDVSIGDKQIFDWVSISIGITPGGKAVVQIGTPLGNGPESEWLRYLIKSGDEYQINIVANRIGSDYSEGGFPAFIIAGAKPILYELVPMEMGGVKVAGLDSRSDVPVIQAITFEGTVFTPETKTEQ